MFERHKEVARVSMENRQSIVAAGIYKDPIPYLNEASVKYAEMVYLNANISELSSSDNTQSNEDLFEEWKQIFGKIDDNKSPETEPQKA